jgi:eukaryotic-like serine/threonine-protein kinase
VQPERWSRICNLFDRAMEVPAEERDAFLVAACEGDDALLTEVRAIVRASPHASMLDRVVSRALDDRAAIDDRSVAGLRLGAYRILETVGIGGMGTVYLAERADQEFEQRVAIKVVRAGRFDDVGRTRLRAERQILAGLDHPFIARLLDGGTTEDGVPYFVMEYVDGVPIHEYVERQALTTRARIELMLQVCEAVAFAHGRLVVHRDLKPRNILIAPDGTPKLLDFGIARLLTPDDGVAGSNTITLAGMMTPDYASPEQIRGEAVSTASDVYSLGVVLYRLLTGRTPHDLGGRSPAEAERIVSTVDPERPSRAASQSDRSTESDSAAPSGSRQAGQYAGDAAAVQHSLAGDLDSILLKALRRDPSERYGSVVELATDLRRHLDGLPISARAPTAGYRLSKFVRRNAAAVAATAAAFLLLSVSLGVAVAQGRSADRARVDAELAREQAEEALATSQTVTQYLTSVFSAADPRENLGAEISIREALDRGRESIGGLDSQPAVQAEVLETLGFIYFQLGLYDTSAEVNGQAAALRRSQPDTTRFVNALNQLAMALIQGGVRDSAIVVLEEAIAVGEPALGDEHDAVLAALSNLAVAYRRVGRESEAETMYRKVVAVESATLGPDDPTRSFALNNLAHLLTNAAKYEEAEQLAREALRLRSAQYDEKHPAINTLRMNLGVTLRSAGRLADADSLLTTALQMFTEVLGPDHAQVAEAQHALGLLLVDRGTPDDLIRADSLLHSALAVRIAALGENHASIGWYTHALGSLEARRGNLRDAEAWFEQAVAQRSALHMDAPRTIVESLLELALVRDDLGNDAGALAAVNRARAIVDDRIPSDDILTAWTHALTGLIAGAGAAAAPSIDASILTMRNRVGSQHRWVVRTCEHAARLALPLTACVPAGGV